MREPLLLDTKLCPFRTRFLKPETLATLLICVMCFLFEPEENEVEGEHFSNASVSAYISAVGQLSALHLAHQCRTSFLIFYTYFDGGLRPVAIQPLQ